MQRAGFAAQYALARRGPMTMAPSQLGAFVKSDPARETPNLQYHIQPLTLPKFGEPLDPVPGVHGERRQHPADQPRLGAHHVARSRGASRDPARTIFRPRRTATSPPKSIRVTRNIVSMPALAQISARGVPARPRVPERRGAGKGRRRHLHHDLPSRRHCQDGQRRRRPSSITGSGCAASRACGSPMPRSCRPSRPATPTRRP